LVEHFNKRKHLVNLVEFVRIYQDENFYITRNNTRIFIKDCASLKPLLKSSCEVLVYTDGPEITGILSVWKAKGGNVKRNYIKINAINENIGDKLLSVLFWNRDEDFYIKISKYSKLLNLLRYKNFRFFHDRGREWLLRRIKWQ